MAHTPPLPAFADLAAYPVLHVSHAGAWLLRDGANVEAISRGDAISLAADTPVLLLNAPLVAARLGYPDLSGLDLLELFAFVHPARFCVPTPKGIAHALDLPPPPRDNDVPLLLRFAAQSLLDACHTPHWAEREGAWSSLESLHRLRWAWAPVLGQNIAKPERAEKWLFSRLPEWEEGVERPAPRTLTLDTAEISAQLDHLTGHDAERRAGQHNFAHIVGKIFAPRTTKGHPHIVLAQAGTGIGKTLGYLAPSSLWGHASGGTIWASTYTKNLQRQLRRESVKAWPARRSDGSKPVVVRKGRENYLCLLNLEDALQGGFGGRPAILAHLVARWAAYSEDGDIIGGDLPGWLGTLFRQRAITSLTDQRGECVYAACPHYRKCFIEHSARASAQADLVIANHALMMVNAARGRDHAPLPSRMIFDEGHHVFDAADSMFSAVISGREMVELRRWILGPERGTKGRRRGLAARLADLASQDEKAGAAIRAAANASEVLPSEGWLARVVDGDPLGALEGLLQAVRGLTYARDESGHETAYSIETEITDLPAALIDCANDALESLSALHRPLVQLAVRLEEVIKDPPDWLDGQGRQRIEGARHSLAWRIDLLASWQALLARLGGPPDLHFVDWFGVERGEGREFDIGIYRHWVDPMIPFAKVVLEPSHGVLITSATLKDGSDWAGAITASGAPHLNLSPEICDIPSPFEYATRAEIILVTDIKRGDSAAMAGAYAQIIEACGGGVLGLFTAIKRLRAVHTRIADRLARSGLPLYAQHVDPIDTGTLVDIFRDDPAASLLGTDALRDGVDVPGHSLRCVVMEGVPWPKPTILHRARKAVAEIGGQAFDDRIIRARLAQAFGRLIRSQDDHGHFIILSSAFPSRLLDAFPNGTPVLRLTLEEALHRVQSGVFGDRITDHFTTDSP